METFMTQLDLLTKHAMGVISKMVNVVDSKDTNTYNDDDEESLDEEIQFISNQMEGFVPTYQRQCKIKVGKKGTAKGKIMIEIEIKEIKIMIGEIKITIIIGIPQHDKVKGKDFTFIDSEKYKSEYVLAHILIRVERNNKMLKVIKSNFLQLNQNITSHLKLIKQLEVQLGQIFSHLNARQNEGLSSDTVANPKNDAHVSGS